MEYDDREEDYDHDEWCRDDDDYSGREEPPMFGCACENAMCVDTVCDYCIADMREYHEADHWANQNVATVEG